MLFVRFVGSDNSVSAQAPKPADADPSPVARVRDARSAKSWEMGPFVNYGTGVGDRSDFKFLWGGFQLGKAISPLHAGILSGQFELAATSCRFWQAYTPAPHQQTFYYPGTRLPHRRMQLVAPEGGGTFRGVSVTPVIFRWNFLTSRIASALVPGRRRAHLHHPQVSAGSTCSARELRAELPFGTSRRRAALAPTTLFAPSGPSIWA
jgi:hypothetical protein